jgi:hypothetical protein
MPRADERDVKEGGRNVGRVSICVRGPQIEEVPSTKELVDCARLKRNARYYLLSNP